MTADFEARARLRAYSRRWRVNPVDERNYDWLQAYVRRMRVLDRQPLLEASTVTPIGNLFDLLQWVPRQGHS